MESPHYAVRTVACADDHADWSPPETTAVTQVVLVQRGRFRVRSHDHRTTVDPTTGYLHPRGHETSFAHPAGGDLCTTITVSGDTLTSQIDPARTRTVRVDARLELAHRMLLRSTADPDFETVEAVVNLLQLALRRRPDESPAPGSHDLADRAREAILAEDPSSAGLVALARRLQTSPAHLSRTFRHHAGLSISRYRNRVRISRALQCMADGATDLAGLAFTLGFSDQAHLTRTMRHETGRSPGEVRALLTHARSRGTAH